MLLKVPTLTVCYFTYGRTRFKCGGLPVDWEGKACFPFREEAFKLLQSHGFTFLGLSSRDTLSYVSFSCMITRALAGA